MILLQRGFNAEKHIKGSQNFSAALIDCLKNNVVLRKLLVSPHEAFHTISPRDADFSSLQRCANCLGGSCGSGACYMEVPEMLIDVLRDRMIIKAKHGRNLGNLTGLLAPSGKIFVQECSHAPCLSKIVRSPMPALGMALPPGDSGGSQDGSNASKCLHPGRPYLSRLLVYRDEHRIESNNESAGHAGQDANRKPESVSHADLSHLTSVVFDHAIVCGGTT